MAEKGVIFDRVTGQKVLSATRDVLNEPTDLTGKRLPYRGGGIRIIPVRLTQTGGSAGTRTTECTFTYTLKTLDNVKTIAESVGLIGHRVINAAMTAATYGFAGKNADGDWKIFWCDERIQQNNCS